MPDYTLADFGTPAFNQNPFPIWEQLRQNEPLYRMDLPDGSHAWMITHYDDILAISKDPRFIRDAKKLVPEEVRENMPPSVAAVRRMLGQQMMNADPPEHTRLRQLVSKAFTPRMVEQLRGRIQQITDELLDRVEAHGQMDLIADFAFLLPVTVICEMLGVPVEDRDKFRVWSSFLVKPREEQSQMEFLTILNGFIDYIKALLEEKRSYPDEKLLSRLIRVEEAGDKLSQDELISMAFLLLVAGYETTVNLIGNGSLALLLHPQQMRKLQKEPALIVNAVEELLRYSAPITLTQRWANEDVELHGKHIARGDAVYLALMAANHEPAHFPNPEELDLAREPNEHLAFGKGLHFCLGAPLARLEGQIALQTLLRRFPNLHLTVKPEELKWRASLGFRGLQALPVAF
ncbi:cytochrome P450 [Ktedonosporobacter rubrisoli]|uniref:Cytochrome P450 n=1 Tax=Ktedonosporobacter rubrisoli TaxID=2509675 RepID=A0A4P6JJ45_KTERU|nr:cytochrome P450 [Ktedonosporobacter rubrisoli]QBD74932.1 cytochrome P450 [Ktedonosporobacter rubrisoli]